MKPRYDRLKCADCGVPWEDHAKDPRRLCFAMENTTAEEVRQHIVALTVLVEQLRAANADAQERIQALDPLPLPMYHNRQKVERLAPAAGPGGAPVSFGWKVGWVADELVRVRADIHALVQYLAIDKALRAAQDPESDEAKHQRAALVTLVAEMSPHALAIGCEHQHLRSELSRVTAELEGLRTYLTRSIAADIDDDTEAWEILAGLPDEDMAIISRWLEEMREPAYWSQDIARLTAELAQAREELAGRYRLQTYARPLPPDIASPPVCAWTPPETWRLAVTNELGTWVELESSIGAYAAPGGDVTDWTVLMIMLRAGTPGRAAMRLAWHAELGIFCFRNHHDGLATPFRFNRDEAPAVATWLGEELFKLGLRVVVPVLDGLDELP